MTDKELLEKILSKVEGTENKINGMKTDISGMKTQQEESYKILKNLEHNSNVNAGEHDTMFNKITHIEGHLKNISESVDVMKDVIGRHQIDIEILKRRPV